MTILEKMCSPDEVIILGSFSGISFWESALNCALMYAGDMTTCDALSQVYLLCWDILKTVVIRPESAKLGLCRFQGDRWQRL